MLVLKRERLKTLKEEAASLRRLNATHWVSTSHTEAEWKAHEARRRRINELVREIAQLKRKTSISSEV
jgi:hypothetical protein